MLDFAGRAFVEIDIREGAVGGAEIDADEEARHISSYSIEGEQGQTMAVLGLDIGGANLKAADTTGRAVQRPFALWKEPDRLVEELEQVCREFHSVRQIVVTMTGELCDCFASKAEGVWHILSHVDQLGLPCQVWTQDGWLVSIGEARKRWESVAAANWFGLARFASRFVPTGTGLVIDIGSTTTDIVPLVDGRPVPRGRTDPERLATGELVYCGVRRTPLCAIFGLSKAAEFFATTEDVYVILDRIPEEPTRRDTADGRPRTKEHAFARLARMECAEPTDREHLIELARDARARQVDSIAERVRQISEQLPAPISRVVTTGAGEFLISEALARAGLGAVARTSLADHLGPSLSTAACAYAIAVLAWESA
jgi:probable H4MPT-linked C1 transfer pathway protein